MFLICWYALSQGCLLSKCFYKSNSCFPALHNRKWSLLSLNSLDISSEMKVTATWIKDALRWLRAGECISFLCVSGMRWCQSFLECCLALSDHGQHIVDAQKNIYSRKGTLWSERNFLWLPCVSVHQKTSFHPKLKFFRECIKWDSRGLFELWACGEFGDISDISYGS